MLFIGLEQVMAATDLKLGYLIVPEYRNWWVDVRGLLIRLSVWTGFWYRWLEIVRNCLGFENKSTTDAAWMVIFGTIIYLKLSKNRMVFYIGW